MRFVFDLEWKPLPEGTELVCAERLLFDRWYEPGESVPHEKLGIPWSKMDQLARVRKMKVAPERKTKLYLKKKGKKWNVFADGERLNSTPFSSEDEARLFLEAKRV